MKKLQRSLGIIAALGAAWFSTQTARAVTTWNATGGNWSVGANWDTLAAPGASDDVRFLNVGAGTANTMDLGFSINSLTYGQDNQALHTTTVNPGLTLAVNRTGAGDVLYVGSTSASITAATLVPVAIAGTGTLTLSGTGDLVVRQGFCGEEVDGSGLGFFEDPLQYGDVVAQGLAAGRRRDEDHIPALMHELDGMLSISPKTS